jgi:hypothetical protein
MPSLARHMPWPSLSFHPNLVPKPPVEPECAVLAYGSRMIRCVCVCLLLGDIGKDIEYHTQYLPGNYKRRWATGLFLQAHRETEAHFSAAGMPSHCNQSESVSFRFKRAAFYQGLKSKVGLAAAKAAALRINLNVQGCSIVAAPMHAPSRTPLLLPLLLSHNLPLPRVH